MLIFSTCPIISLHPFYYDPGVFSSYVCVSMPLNVSDFLISFLFRADMLGTEHVSDHVFLYVFLLSAMLVCVYVSCFSVFFFHISVFLSASVLVWVDMPACLHS